MKISGITQQVRDPNRLNILIDGKYSFSLDIQQVVDLGVKVGNEYSEVEIQALKTEGDFGKLYAQALEYAMSRPRSQKEMTDYLWRKTLTKKYRSRQTGEIHEREGASPLIARRVLERLVAKNYVNDEQFARFWVENRMTRKGISQRKLVAELRAKGVDSEVIDEVIQNSPRDEKSELYKMIQKKQDKYADEQKLIAYLARQGFSYDDIKSALADNS